MTTFGIPDQHREGVRAIARSFGVADREISVAPRQGQVNLTIFLGTELVLRLPRRPDLEQRLAKEARVIPFVRDRGIPTAELVTFDTTRALTDVAYMVLERLHGPTIDDLPATEDGHRTRNSLSEILVSLHSLRRDVEPAIPGVETADFSSLELLDELASAGEIGSSQAEWLGQWFARLEAQGARSSEPVLLHGDVMPSNLILNEDGEVAAIIDWGSACWGEAARDLAGLRTSELPRVVHAYTDVACTHVGLSSDAKSLEAGVLWYQLFFALARLLGRQSTSENRNWSAPRGARLVELLRFFSTDAS